MAKALEGKGDWAAAMDEYKQAANADAAIDLRGKVVRLDEREPQREYKDAQSRLNQVLAGMRAAGKTSEAAQLQASVQAKDAAQTLSQKIDAALQAGAQANAISIR